MESEPVAMIDVSPDDIPDLARLRDFGYLQQRLQAGPQIREPQVEDFVGRKTKLPVVFLAEGMNRLRRVHGRQHYQLSRARFPGGSGFIESVRQLAQEVAAKLQIGAEVLNGSVGSLEHVDEAAQRLGGQYFFDDPTILAPIVAYVGELIREATDGHWEIRTRDFREGEDSDRWEPVIVAFCLDIEEFIVATGELGTVPEDAYQVTQRYGDGTPRTVRFNRNARIAGFPCRAVLVPTVRPAQGLAV
jgi:hypothetical protein